MKNLTTITALAALAWLPPTSTASAQEARRMTIEEAIAEEATTIEEALEALQREGLGGPAFRLLRQVTLLGIPVNPLPAVELDAFADRLAAMVLDPTLPEHVRDKAAAVLASAADPAGNRRGTPYARAFDLLVRAYEGGYDDALGDIFWSDPERGPAYVRGVFERIERPPLCRWRYDGDHGWVPMGVDRSRSPKDDLPGCDGYNYRRDARPTPWCRAGHLLFRDVVSQARKRTPRDRLRRMGAGAPQPVPDGLPEHVEDWHRRCR